MTDPEQARSERSATCATRAGEQRPPDPPTHERSPQMRNKSW
ncbi:hypothetical protein ACFQV8_21395 [Pseudonocardia benzenivorans]